MGHPDGLAGRKGLCNPVRQPEDASLLYATGMIHYQLDQLQQASAYLQRAMETATLRSDQQSYQLQLDQVRREMLAGI